MPRLPVLSGVETVRAFELLGWNTARQRGSHIIMTKPGEMASLAVPNHTTVAKGTLRRLLRDAGVTVAEFCAVL